MNPKNDPSLTPRPRYEELERLSEEVEHALNQVPRLAWLRSPISYLRYRLHLWHARRILRRQASRDQITF